VPGCGAIRSLALLTHFFRYGIVGAAAANEKRMASSLLVRPVASSHTAANHTLLVIGTIGYQMLR
jgi:hypothetical protein